MALPKLIEMVPLDQPVRAAITVPGSKSITNRALILAALAEGETVLRGALWSEDTQVMVESLQELGFMVNLQPDPDELCNRTITVYGKGGAVPRGGTEQHPLELFVGNAGTAARFLSAFVCLGQGVYRLEGVPRMHERPQAALFQALRQLGYRVESGNEKLPATIYGGGAKQGKCRVSIEESSQFASALLLSGTRGGWGIEVVGQNAEESPYVAMTAKMIEAFPKAGGVFTVEGDASSGSYFAAASDYEILKQVETKSDRGFTLSTETQALISVKNWPKSNWQVDARFLQFAPLVIDLNSLVSPWVTEHLKSVEDPSFPERWRQQLEEFRRKSQAKHGPTPISRITDLGDSIMTLIVLAPLGNTSLQFTDLGRLRVQECERVAALKTELTKCGARVIEEGDTLIVHPSKLHGAEIETYGDHRMAMCFAVLGLKVPGIKIKEPACVRKTFPNFFQKLATAPPGGLGAIIRDGRTGWVLGPGELFAD